LSYTSGATASQAIRYPKTLVIWSHSSARAIHDREQNVPDEVLELTRTDGGKNDAVILECIFLTVSKCAPADVFALKVNFAAQFVASIEEGTVQTVPDKCWSIT